MPVKMSGIKWGKGQPRQRTSAGNWKEPVKWDKASLKAWDDARGTELPLTEPARHRVFCASLADWLDEEVPIEWLADLLKLIHDTPNLDWLLLTKRPENWKERIEAILALERIDGDEDFSVWLDSWLDCLDMPERGDIPQNVWIGTTVENQEMADERIPELLTIPAKVHFLSCEPLLGPVDLNTSEKSGPMAPVDWVIIGGESGKDARPCNVEWIQALVEQCQEAGVPVFVKQLGSKPVEEYFAHTSDCENDYCALAGGPDDCSGQVENALITTKHPKGGDINEWPADIRIRQFPTIHHPLSTID